MSNNKQVSNESHNQAALIAKGTQKPGQNKEQTKLITAGIEKGIAQYKKQHKAKMREQDKLRKKRDKASTIQADDTEVDHAPKNNAQSKLPWLLLLVSWLGFAAYITLSSNS